MLLVALAGCGGRGEASRGEAPNGAFVDVTSQAGLDFVHVNGAFGRKYFPETMGGGCAFLDYDGDGRQDVLLANSGYWTEESRAHGGQRDTTALYRNEGGGRFRDVSREAGVDVRFYALGVAAADDDGDGDVDVVLTGVGGNRLLRNDGGRFRDATEGSGLAGDGTEFNASAGFFDADGDGDLDLFVCDYVRWTKAIDNEIGFRVEGIGRLYSPPWVWEGRHCHFYRNRGDGTYDDDSASAGIQVLDREGKPAAKALAVTFFDHDGDGDLDVYVCNDTVPNFLFRNRGDGVFDEVGLDHAVSLGGGGAPTGAMGVDVADLDDDGGLAIAVGNWSTEANSLYVRGRDSTFYSDRAAERGFAGPTLGRVTFGLFFFDYDLDGALDLFETNGGLDLEGERMSASLQFLQPSQLFRGVREGGALRFALVPDAEAGDAVEPVVGRGAAFADIDDDGDLDVLVTQPGRRCLLLRNRQDTGHHWLRVRLRQEGMNRDAIGAVVEVDAGGRTQRRQVMPTRSYLSQVELPVTFGLGELASVDAVRVRWPDGHVQAVPVEGVDRLLEVRRVP